MMYSEDETHLIQTMKSILWKVAICCLLCQTALLLPAQEIADSTLKKAVSESLTEYLKKQIAGKTVVKTIVADPNKQRIVVTMDENLAYLSLKESDVEQLYLLVKSLLPDSLQKSRIELLSDGKAVEELVPNVFRSSLKVDKSRLFNNKDAKIPLVQRVSLPYTITCDV